MTLARFIAVAISFTMGATVYATPLVWQLNNVVFNDGGQATGSYTYDAATNTLSNWSIHVSGGDTTTFPAFTYNTITSTTFPDPASENATHVALRDPTQFCCGNPGQERLVALVLTVAMTGAGGTIPLATLGAPDVTRECYNCTPARIAISGTVSTVPEPRSAAFVIVVSALLLASTRRMRSMARQTRAGR